MALTPAVPEMEESRLEETSEANSDSTSQLAPTAVKTLAHKEGGGKILRFCRSERLVHWAIAVPYLVSYASALVLVVLYNSDPLRPYRDVFSWIHRISGLCLLVLPMIAVCKCRGDIRIHFYNIKQAWTWVFADFKWLALMMLAALNSKIKLPEQGKFNAAEKINFMVLLGTYPLYIATGFLMLLTNGAVLAWIVHFAMALMAIPLILGHMYMALLNRSGRPGLQGMISGRVDRQWAKHHYRLWYNELHGSSEGQELEVKDDGQDLPITANSTFEMMEPFATEAPAEASAAGRPMGSTLLALSSATPPPSASNPAIGGDGQSSGQGEGADDDGTSDQVAVVAVAAQRYRELQNKR